MDTKYQQPLVVICGPTASGKTATALQLAHKYNGEIICADSRTVYKGMDIGTAKPSQEEQQEVTHHLLDVVWPGDRFTAYDFQQLAFKAIEDIRSRNKLPIIVGGTGLYIDSVIFNYQFPAQVPLKVRSRYEKMSIEELHKYCTKNNIKLPENHKNKRYLINSIVRKSNNNSDNNTIIDNIIIVGITTNKEELKQRIMQRAEHMFDRGIVDEAKKLGKIYGWNNEAMTGNIYPLVKECIDGNLSYEKVIDKFTTLDWQLARRQITWLKRNSHIQWMPRDLIFSYISSRLNDQQARTN